MTEAQVSRRNTIYVALGANLPGLHNTLPAVTLHAALRAILCLEGIAQGCRSNCYRTTPIPPSDQPDYVNFVVRFRAEIEPERLLDNLKTIETAYGRRRGEINGARSIDLDIIDIAGLVRDAPDPVLPHPRAHLRGFVLYPLRDVAPDWIHPRLGISVGALIANLPPQGIRPA